MYGRGSPRRGSREKERWGVVALAVIETQKEETHTEINRAHKNPQPEIPLWKSIQHIYETPEILRPMIFSTVSCLQSDNGVSTSNTRCNIQSADNCLCRYCFKHRENDGQKSEHKISVLVQGIDVGPHYSTIRTVFKCSFAI